MPVPYRCKRRRNGKTCDTRVSLPKLATLYEVPPLCPTCDKPLTYIDRAQQARNKREKCNCGGVEHIHKTNTFGCIYYKGNRVPEDLMPGDTPYYLPPLPEPTEAERLGATTLDDSNDPPF